MKKILSLLFLAILVMASNVFAANSSFVVTEDLLFGHGGRMIKLTFLFDDTDASTAETLTISARSATDRLGAVSYLSTRIEGWRLTNIYIDGDTGGTEVKDDSDLTITSAGGIDFLNGVGANVVDDDTEFNISPQDVNSNVNYMKITDGLVITVTQEADEVESATGVIYLILE